MDLCICIPGVLNPGELNLTDQSIQGSSLMVSDAYVIWRASFSLA